MAAGATFGGPFAPIVGVMGMDNMVTGLQIMWTGRQHSTSLYQVVDTLGDQTGLYGPQGASFIEIALNLGSTVNPKALTFAFRPVDGRARALINTEIFPKMDLKNHH